MVMDNSFKFCEEYDYLLSDFVAQFDDELMKLIDF